MSLARMAYRARQFLSALGSRGDATGLEIVASRLSAKQQRLFHSMTVRDQRHCLDVYHALRRLGCQDGDLLLAALLHDVGKGSVRLWHRVAYVLLKGVSPGLVDWVARSDGWGWRGAVASLRDHAALGAALAEEAGAPAAAVGLIRRHGARDLTDGRLALLQVADEDC
jgi:predicted HD phosphohydrolase